MLAILLLVEFFGRSLVVSAIAWLRYLYGAPFVTRDWEVRYVVPVLLALFVVIFTIMSIQHRTTINQPDTYPADVGLSLGLCIALAALVVWLIVEVGRYRTGSRNVSHGNRPYSRIAPPHRRAKIRRGKNRPR